uniref:KIB1-4 beta-propeller domain-containing protein n=1 Tax=Aegilops tauschii TaxID=37682 RepID=M8C5Z4_AEGTA
MGLCLGKTSSHGPSPWPDLPQELVGLILRRVPSHADRISFEAVCHDWRLAAKQQRPPAMPWINLRVGSYQSIVDGKIYCFAAPSCRPRASFGSWFLYEHSGQLFLHGLLSGNTPTIEIPCCYHECTDDCDVAAHDRGMTVTLMGGTAMARLTMYKIVVCSFHLLAAILYTGGTNTTFSFAFYRPGTLSWSLLRASDYKDIAFHRGRIFALTSTEELFIHEVMQPCHFEHIIEKRPATAAVDASEYFRVKFRLVVSSDETKLLMVRWSIPGGDGIHRTMMKLQVFEAELQKKERIEVKDLGDQVLFISNTCSRAIVSSTIEHTDIKFGGGNRVFLLGTDWACQWITASPCRCYDCDRILAIVYMTWQVARLALLH